MSPHSLKKAFSPLFVLCAVASFAATQVSPQSARANMCDYNCMAYGGPAFSPFGGTPWVQQNPYGYPNSGSYYQTGQMPDYRSQLAQALAWNGTQPLGYSYLPPIGLQAIQNNMSAAALGI